MIKKFAITGVTKGWKGIQKLKAQKVPKPQIIIKQKKRQLFRYNPKTQSIGSIQAPFDTAHPGIKDLILKAGKTTAAVTQRRLFKKFPGQKVKAHKLAQLKGLKKVKVLSKKYEVQGLTSVKDRPKTFYKAKKGSGLPSGMTQREMGWAPSAPMSAEQIAFKAAQSPKALVKKHRKTLSKIYTKPKTWKKRAELKSYYRSQIKSELKVAKIDRSIFRTQTVQKLNPKTGRYKTIRKYKKYTY